MNSFRLVICRTIKKVYLLLILLISAASFAYNHKPVILKPAKPVILKIAIPGKKIVPPLQPKARFLFANPDQTVIVCGSSTILTPTTNNAPPGYSNLTWSDGSKNPTLTVTSSGTYWWQETGSNIVSNGDFSSYSASGPVGFTSSYAYKTPTSPCPSCCCGALTPEAAYGVNTDPRNLHSLFTSFGDHTTGTGNMLIVNGSSTANVTVWTQNINITANTDYVFSFWATSATVQSPAILQFSINGNPLGSNVALSSSIPDGTWQYFTATWNSSSTSGSVPIALVNQNTAATGNDFAIDDIVFAPVYRQNIIVTLNPNPVLALTSPHTACGYYDLTQAITGYNTTTYTYTFTDSGGVVVPNPQAITQSGTYTITETNKTTGCTSAPQNTTITINPNPAQPGITAL